MKLIIKPVDGLLVGLTMNVLKIFGTPLDWIHEGLKKPFNSLLKKFLTWTDDDVEGLYIELWTIIWTAINIFILLRGLALASSLLWYACLIIMMLRAFDFLKAFLAMNLQLSNNPQRSLARSYAMLFLAFLEMGAITSSIQLLICKDFYVGTEQANWINVFYYSLRNMVTVGGGDITFSSSCSSCSAFLFGVVRVAQPLFSLLLVTLAIGQILNYKKQAT